MNLAFIQSCFDLSRASAQIYARCASNAVQAFSTPASRDKGAAWPAAIGRTLDLASGCMQESTGAVDAAWQAYRTTLGLDAIALTLRTLQGISADTEAAQADLRAQLAADCTKQISGWLLGADKARDANDLLLCTFVYGQGWQDSLKSFLTGYAGLATRTASATLQGVRSSMQAPAASVATK